MIATPLNWIVRPVVLRQFIWFVFLAFLRIIARKARSFAARPKTMGQEMTKIPGGSRDVVSPVLNFRMSLSSYAMERRPTRSSSSSISFDGRSRSRDSLRMISSSMLMITKVFPFAFRLNALAMMPNALWECALNLSLYIDLSNCFVKFAHEKESLTVDVLARFMIMNASVRVTKWNAMHIYNIPMLCLGSAWYIAIKSVKKITHSHYTYIFQLRLKSQCYCEILWINVKHLKANKRF